MNKFEYIVKENSTSDLIMLKKIAILFTETDFEFASQKKAMFQLNYLAEWLNNPKFRKVHFFVCENKNGDILGAIYLKTKSIKKNGKAKTDMRINSSYRNIGLESLLYKEVTKYSLINNINTLEITVNKFNPCKDFWESIGARIKDTVQENISISKHLNIFEFNYTSQKIRHEIFKNSLPKKFLKDLVKSKKFLNDRNMGNRIIDESDYSIEFIQNEISSKNSHGIDTIISLFYSVDNLKVIGYNEIEYQLNSNLAYLSETAVHRDYRNKGLGSEIRKIAISNVMKMYKVKYIRSYNSVSNTAIIKICQKYNSYILNTFEKREKIYDYE